MIEFHKKYKRVFSNYFLCMFMIFSLITFGKKNLCFQHLFLWLLLKTVFSILSRSYWDCLFVFVSHMPNSQSPYCFFSFERLLWNNTRISKTKLLLGLCFKFSYVCRVSSKVKRAMEWCISCNFCSKTSIRAKQVLLMRLSLFSCAY